MGSFIQNAAFVGEYKAAEYLQNQIKLENFIINGKKDELIRLKPNCSIEIKGWFSSGTQQIDDKFLNGAYMELYDYLIKKKIINSRLGVATFFTADFIHTINKDLIEKNVLTEKLKDTNQDFPKLLKCYEINCDKLSNFLKKYTYGVADDAYALGNYVLPKKSAPNTKKSASKTKSKMRGGKRKSKKSKKYKK